MKALWALEPFHQDNLRIKGMYQQIIKLGVPSQDVEIGFVVTKMENELLLAFHIPKEERFTKYPLMVMKKVLKKAGIRIAEKRIHIVKNETISTTKAVDRLLAEASKYNCDLLALYTHARYGFMRLFGSFAETALHRSKINLLMANPKTQFSKKISTLFFAIDFISYNKYHIKYVAQLSETMNTKLVIFYASQIIYDWSLDESSPEIQNYRNRVKKVETQVSKICSDLNLDFEIIIDNEYIPVAQRVFKYAKKKKADLIIVSARVGSMAALMGGSITRQIVRNSFKPVLILK